MPARTALFLLFSALGLAGPGLASSRAQGPDQAQAQVRLLFSRASFAPADLDGLRRAARADGAGDRWAGVAAAARSYNDFLGDFPTLSADGVSERVRALGRTFGVGDDELRTILPLYLSRCAAAGGGASVCRAPSPRTGTASGPTPPPSRAPPGVRLPGDGASLPGNFGAIADGGGGGRDGVAAAPGAPARRAPRAAAPARDYPTAVPRRLSAGLDRGAVPAPSPAAATRRHAQAEAAKFASVFSGDEGLAPQDRYLAGALKGLFARYAKASGAARYLRQYQALVQAGKPDPARLRAWENEVSAYLKFKSGAAPAVAAPDVPGLRGQDSGPVDEATSENCWQALAAEHATIAQLCSSRPRTAAALAGAYQAVVDQAKGLVSLGNVLLILGTFLIGGLLSGGIADVIGLLLAIGFSLYMAYQIVTEYGPRLLAAVRDLWRSRSGSAESFQKWKETAYFATTTIAAIVMIYLGAKGAEGLATKLSKMSAPGATAPSFAAMAETMRSPAKLMAEQPGVLPRAARLMKGEGGAPPMRLVPALRTATASTAADVAAGVKSVLRKKPGAAVVVENVVSNLSGPEEAAVAVAAAAAPKLRETAPEKGVEKTRRDEPRGPMAEQVLSKELSPAQQAAVQRAHEVGAGEPGRDGAAAAKGNYTAAQLRAKAAILKQAGFASADIRALMENGVVGEDRPVVAAGAAPKPGPAIADEVQLLELNGTVAERGLGPAVAERAAQLGAAAERRRVQASSHPGDSAEYRALMAQSASLEAQAREMRAYAASVGEPAPRAPAPAPSAEPIRGLRMTDRPAGGTQGGRWFQDADGRSYFGKSYGGNRDRLGSENAVDQIYRLFDVAAPETRLAQFQGRTWLLSRELPGRPAGSAAALAKTDVRGGFVVDAWLGNRDVIGLGYDNVLVDGGRAYRVDNGGSLMWRAQGERKPFGPKVEEISSMRDRNYESGTVFGGLTKGELIAQLREFAAKYEERRAQVEQAVDRSGVSPELGAQIKEALAARARYLKAVLEKNDQPEPRARAAEPAPAAPAAEVTDFRGSLKNAAGFEADEAALAKNPNGMSVPVNGSSKFLPDLKYIEKVYKRKVDRLYTGQTPKVVADMLDQGGFLTKAAKEGRTLKDAGGAAEAVQRHVIGGETSYFVSTTDRRATAFGDFGQTKGYVLDIQPKQTRFYSTRSLSEDGLGSHAAEHESEYLAYGAIPIDEIPAVHSTISGRAYSLSDPAQVQALREELAWVESETAENGGALDTFRLRDLWKRRAK